MSRAASRCRSITHIRNPLKSRRKMRVLLRQRGGHDVATRTAKTQAPRNLNRPNPVTGAPLPGPIRSLALPVTACACRVVKSRKGTRDATPGRHQRVVGREISNSWESSSAGL
jgi:hypothetical protein